MNAGSPGAKVVIGWFLVWALACAAYAAEAGGGDVARRLVPKPAGPVPDGVSAAPPFKLTAETVILHDKDTAELAAMLQKDIADQTGLELKLTTEMKVGETVVDICSGILEARPAPKGAEAYELDVGRSRVTIRASKPAGRFYGTRTLLQLLMPADANVTDGKVPPAQIPALTIADSPRFAWRGLMLDCSRTFQSAEYVKKTIDRMAMYKMNVLHMHLTDDQGWRLEIRKYPELTGKGAEFPAKYNEPARHQGFYTRAQMKELIAYAAARGVTVVPEIEMPGHSLAALACYPRLSCTGGPLEIHPFGKGPGIHKEIYCAGNDETFEFLQNVLAEVIELFPSRYIHIGGDEAPKDSWNKCPKCQARIKAEALKDAHELQSWFIRRIDKFVTSKGRAIIGWDEILEGGLAENAAVMSWRGVRGGQAAAQAGHKVVMSPTSHCYFDYTWKRIDTARAFSFDPTGGMTGDQAGCVLGLQANFWSHIDREEPLVDGQLFPRLLGIAERGWSPKDDADAADFAARVASQLPRLEMLGVNYHGRP
jgi:hexosaminidase